jgi:hypothetical protein
MFDDDEDGNGFHPIMNIMEVVLTLPIKAKKQPLTGCTSTTTHYKMQLSPMAYKLN